VKVKVPVVAPAAIVAVAGTVPCATLLDWSVMTNPPVGAGLAIVSVPVDKEPPTTDVGLNVRPVSTGAVTVNVPEVVDPFNDPVTDTGVLAATATVVALNVAVVAPAGTVTEVCTVTAALPDDNPTVRPPVGAALLTVTVPVEPFPPTTLAGLKETPVTVMAVTVRLPVTVLVVAPSGDVAEIVSVVLVVTEVVFTVNVAVFVPAATVTEAGTVADEPFDDRVTVTEPPVATVPFKVTVPVDIPPSGTEVGLSVTLLTNGT